MCRTDHTVDGGGGGSLHVVDATSHRGQEPADAGVDRGVGVTDDVDRRRESASGVGTESTPLRPGGRR
jgi:hypothetical protein